MKYKSELIHEILEQRGHEVPDLHYQSECVEAWINEYEGAYPKLCDYESEWLNYIVENPIGKFPYETITTSSTTTVQNVVPFAYRSAILKGCTGYRDIDTGGILETFEEGRNLELVSVKMPVLKTVGKNLFTDYNEFIKVNHSEKLYLSSSNTMGAARIMLTVYDENKNLITSKNAISSNSAFYHREMDNKWMLSMNKSQLNEQFTLSDDVKYIVFDTHNGLYMEYENIQLEESSIGTSYEPYKSITLTTPADLELRGVGDVQDTLDCLTGEVTKRIGELVITDNTPSKGVRVTDNGMVQVNIPMSAFNAGNGTTSKDNIRCDKFAWTEANIDNPQEGIRVNGGSLYWAVSISKLSSTDLIGVNNYLSNNPITVQYRLATESVKTVELTVINQDGETLNKLKPIEGTMHVEVTGSPIPPTAVLEVPVEAITQNLNSFIKEE